MKGQQRFIIGLVLALILIVFALLNGQDVSVSFFGIQLKWPLIVIIALIGAVVTWLISTSAVSSAKKQIRELQQRITELTKSNKTDKPAPKPVQAPKEEPSTDATDTKK